MDARAFLSELLMQVAGQPLLLVTVILVATFLLEDLATITVALLASHMVIDGTTALGAAVFGTVLGDVALYALARWAGDRTFVQRWRRRPALARVIAWTRVHALKMLVIARFTPGLRFPVFAGAGVVGIPAAPFIATVTVTTLIWTPGLYYAAARLDMAGLERLGGMSWVAALALVGAIMLAAHLVSARLAQGARFEAVA